jgi:hypothetical protein
MGDHFSQPEQFKNGHQDQSPQDIKVQHNKSVENQCPYTGIESSEKFRQGKYQVEQRYKCNEKYGSPDQPVFIEFPDEFVELADQYLVIICSHDFGYNLRYCSLTNQNK